MRNSYHFSRYPYKKNYLKDITFLVMNRSKIYRHSLGKDRVMKDNKNRKKVNREVVTCYKLFLHPCFSSCMFGFEFLDIMAVFLAKSSKKIKRAITKQ